MRQSNVQPPVGTPLNTGHSLSSGLVGCWLLNGGGKKAFNSSYLVPTPLSATTTTIYKATPGGIAASFSGGDRFNLGGTSSNLALSNRITIAVWVKLGTTGLTNRYILSSRKTTATVGDQFAIIYGFAAQKFEIYSDQYTGTAPRTALATSINDTNWHHIVFTYDGTTVRGYKDGRLDVSSNKTFSFNTNATEFTIGAYDNSTQASDFNGQIRNVMIYNRPLTATEIALLYKDPYCMMMQPKLYMRNN